MIRSPSHEVDAARPEMAGQLSFHWPADASLRDFILRCILNGDDVTYEGDGCWLVE